MSRLVLCLALCWLVSVPALADDLRIDSVRVDGLVRVERGAVLNAAGIKTGATVSPAQISQAIRAIFALGRFEDIQADVSAGEDGRNLLTFTVRERPLVRRVRFEGNEELKEEKLRPLVTFRTPDILNPLELRRSVQALADAYVAEGFYAAQIEPEVETNERNEANVTFRIKEGEKVLIDRIRFEGNRVFSAEELRKAMETKERWWLSWLTGRGKYQPEILEIDRERIADLYFNQGYVRIKVKPPAITLSDDKKFLRLLIEIEEGEQYRVGSVDVSGDILGDKAELLALSRLRPNDIFSREQLRASVLALHDRYADQGYAYVNVAPLTRIEAEERKVHLSYEIEQGVQVYVDRIRITGNTKTRDKVIRREMRLVEGELYSATKVKRSRQRINNLGFFEEVEVSTSKGPDEGLMNLDINVKEGPTGNFTVGAGYSSVDGVVLQGSVQQNNFLGRALKLNLSGSLGGTSTTYTLGLTDPYFLDTKWTLGADLYNTSREYTDFTKDTVGGDLKVGHPIGEHARVFFLYRYEQKEIYDVARTASEDIRDQEGESTLSSIFASWTYDNTDFRMDPTTGNVLQLSVEFAGLGGDEKFAKYIGDYRRFWPLFWNVVFSAHGQIGYAQEIGGQDLPIDERFYLGGLSTIRGFDSRTVGPRIRTVQTVVDPVTGETTSYATYGYPGGNKEAFANLELTFPLIKEAGLKAVVFYDIGNAWGEDEDYFESSRSSAGTGIRWMSPMGPLRLEWGYNLDPLPGEDRTRFEFSIGRFY